MAHFAEIDSNNTVLRVIVVHNNECMDESGNESEEVGAAFCHNTFGGTWVKTSFNGSIRKHFAGLGYTYDAVRDVFIPRKDFASWVFDEVKCVWVPPTPMPDDGKPYVWNEETVSWKEVPIGGEALSLDESRVSPQTLATEQVVVLETQQVEVLTTAQIAPL